MGCRDWGPPTTEAWAGGAGHLTVRARGPQTMAAACGNWLMSHPDVAGGKAGRATESHGLFPLGDCRQGHDARAEKGKGPPRQAGQSGRGFPSPSTQTPTRTGPVQKEAGVTCLNFCLCRAWAPAMSFKHPLSTLGPAAPPWGKAVPTTNSPKLGLLSKHGPSQTQPGRPDRRYL